MYEYTLRKLIDILNKATKAYDEGNPIMTDEEWDNLYFQLKQREELDRIIYPDSPTQGIVYRVMSKLNKIKHEYQPMLSLDKTKNISEIEKFCFAHKDYWDWFAMFKLDGLSCRLTYNYGKLGQAETRGNGIEGEDITHNALVVSNIPKYIPTKEEKIIVDGEIICDLITFNKYFKNDYKNPRNFAAGSIRLLDARECATRGLSFIAWDLVKGYDDIDYNCWRFEKLQDLGFEVVPSVFDAESIDDAIDRLDKDKRHNLYPIDGYVFKFESVEYGKNLGQTDHHFNNAIAYKFYDEEYESKLKYIDYDVSRTGILTPVAVFEPVEIDGTEVSRASLHNLNVMEDILGDCPYIGEPVWIIKSNQIIPQITRAKKLDTATVLKNGGLPLNYDIVCPICGSYTKIVTSDNGIRNLYCANEQCQGKLAQRIDYYCGPKGLDIKGLSRKTIEKLIDWGWINGIKDIYGLDRYRTEWASKTGFGEASVTKILSAIHESLSRTRLEAYISALGIPLIGKTIAKEITKYYSTWDDFRAAVGGDWTQFYGFGDEISKSLNNFDYTEADEIAKIITFAEIQSKETLNQSSAIKDKTFCVTGSLNHFSNRTELKMEIESLGGRIVNSISSKVDYLLTNTPNSGTQKNKDAQRLGIQIITEEEYLKMKTQS